MKREPMLSPVRIMDLPNKHVSDPKQLRSLASQFPNSLKSLSPLTVNVQYTLYLSYGGNTPNPNSRSSIPPNAVVPSREPSLSAKSRFLLQHLHQFQSQSLNLQTHQSLGAVRSGSAVSNSISFNYLLLLCLVTEKMQEKTRNHSF